MAVTDDPATRNITLNAGEDLLLTMPTVISDWTDDLALRDSLVTVVGGRNVVCIGGHIQAKPNVTTTLSVAVGTSETTLTVASTAAFPTTGNLRVDGELIQYGGKTTTTFTGLTRNVGFFNSGPTSSLSHSVGATVYLGESARSGMSFQQQTGTVHVEGVLIDGLNPGDLNDGIRIYGVAGGIYQIQNCRIGPVSSADTANDTDGHPDGIQVWRGPDALRMDRLTIMAIRGKGLLNYGSNNGRILPNIYARDVEVIGQGAAHLPLIVNFDSLAGGTTWEMHNVWANPHSARTDRRLYASDQQDSTPADLAMATPVGDTSPEFCPAGVAGLTYASPGYLP